MTTILLKWKWACEVKIQLRQSAPSSAASLTAKQTAIAVCSKKEKLPLNHHSRKDSPHRDKTSRIYEAGRIVRFQRLVLDILPG